MTEVSAQPSKDGPKGLWYGLNNSVLRTVWEALKRMTGSGSVSTTTRFLAGDHVLGSATVLMLACWIWSMLTTTFRDEKKKFQWGMIEDCYVWPRVSFSVAVVWLVRNDHANYAWGVLTLAVVGIILYFILRRKFGPERERETAAVVFFLITVRIVGVSVAGPYYRLGAGMKEFLWIAIVSTGLWFVLITLSLLPRFRKRMPDGQLEPTNKLVREAIAVPVHVAFGTPLTEWTLRGSHGGYWPTMMGVSVLCIILYWMWYVKTEGWPTGANRRENNGDTGEVPDGP